MNTEIKAWVKKYNKTADSNYQIKNVQLFSDKILILCHYLMNSQCPYTFVPIHNKDLKRMLGKNKGNNYQRVLLCAIDLGLVKRDIRYQRGHHTRRYELQQGWEDKLDAKFETPVSGSAVVVKMLEAYKRNETSAPVKVGFTTLQLLLGVNFYSSLILMAVSGKIRFSAGKNGCKLKLVKTVKKSVQKAKVKMHK